MMVAVTVTAAVHILPPKCARWPRLTPDCSHLKRMQTGRELEAMRLAIARTSSENERIESGNFKRQS